MTENPLKYVPASLRSKYLLDEPQLYKDNTPSADINWEPDLEKYQARTARRLTSGSLKKGLPIDWPVHLKSPLVWDIDRQSLATNCIYRLLDDEKREIKAALQHVKHAGLDAEDITAETFPLPGLHSKLQDLSQDLHSGKGFFVIRGLDPAEFSGEDNTLVFLGISAHIGNRFGRQDQGGRMIGIRCSFSSEIDVIADSILVHIMDAVTHAEASANKSNIQSVYSNVAQTKPFHNDVFCDILALQTRSCAATGGASILSSVGSVYNELAATRPDLIDVLASDDWTFDTFGRDPPYHQRALLHFHDNRVIMNFSRRLLTGSPQSPRTLGIPPMTEAQAEALDALHFTAKKHAIEIKMEAGDLRYINNLAVLHCRDAFSDSDTTKRHLVRLWLRDTGRAWKLPSQLQLASDRVYAELPDVDEDWNFDPIVDSKVLMSRQKSCGEG